MQLKVIASMVIAAACTTIAISYMTYASLVQSATPEFVASEAFQVYQRHLKYVVMSLGGLVITTSLAMLIFGIYLTQKIAGPLVPIERMVEDLIQGNYDADDIKLRQSDELQDIASQLNKLKETLKEKQGTEKEVS